MKKSEKDRIINKIKRIAEVYPITIPSIVVCLLLCFVMLFYNVYFAVAGLLMIVVLAVIGTVINNINAKRLELSVAELNKKLSTHEKYGELQYFPLPVVIFDSTDKMLWYNKLFKIEFLSEIDFENTDIKSFTSGQGIDTIRNTSFIECECGNKKYTAFTSKIEYKGETSYILYFVEDTELKNFRTKYENTRPVFMLINLDSVEDALGDLRESQQSDILGDVEHVLQSTVTLFAPSL